MGELYVRRRRNTESYSRKKKYVDPRPFFIIVCEGKVTEVDYFKSFPYYQNLGGVSSCGYIYSHAPIYIEPEAGQHEQVVHRACRIYAELNKKYGSILPKEVWCIFDCDSKQRHKCESEDCIVVGFRVAGSRRLILIISRKCSQITPRILATFGSHTSPPP